MDLDIEQRRAAAAAVREAMDAENIEPLELAALARISVDTLRDFLAARRWPRTSSRNAIERHLGWPLGRIQQIARAYTPPKRDPVREALERSGLPEHDRLEIMNLYLDKLHQLQRRRGAVRPKNGRAVR